MNEQLILRQYQQITELLSERRLNEACTQLESFVRDCNNWALTNRLEQTQTAYRYMLQYMRQGMTDPNRYDLHKKLLADTWEIADQARVLMLDKVSGSYYHILRNNQNSAPEGYGMDTLLRVLEGFSDEMAVCRLTPGFQGLNGILSRHEDTHRFLFLMTWSNSHWTAEETKQAQAFLKSDLLPENDLCLFISAVTLSLMEVFDDQKLNFLLDGIQHKSVQASQRALIGLIFTLHIHPQRIELYPALKARISLNGEDPAFVKQINRVYIQLLRSQETEKIDKKMRDEIIPEMMRNSTIMRNIRFGFEESEENDINPDWEAVFEKSGLDSKIREMNELQLEGADVYMSTFSQLKRFPFFKEPHNWFYPFDPQHSSVIHQVGINPTGENAVLSILLSSGFFCNSDKYSFCFTIAELPQKQRDMMLGQFSAQDREDMKDKENNASLQEYAARPENISNQYIHDLYRFFKLSQRKSEFRNIFQEEIALHRNPVLKEILKDSALLNAVADFHFKKERFVEAIELYQILIDRKSADADIFQKIGYCLQKEKRYFEATNAYQKADVLKPDHLWTLRHLATCFRQIKDFNSALKYYQRVESIEPDNHNILFYTGSCLAEQGNYEEALKYFFKLDYLENDCVKAWRGIGWCSFICGKYEQAMKYYDKILNAKPLTIDYLNAGHVSWGGGDIEYAVTLYSKAILECGGKDIFLEIFNRDRSSLIRQGIKEEDIPLMLDMI